MKSSRSILALVVCSAALAGTGLQPAAASHLSDVTAVSGLAYNWYSDISLFGGPSVRFGYGPTLSPPGSTSPSVTCPTAGGTASATDADGSRAQYGPATVFSGKWPEQNNTAPPSGPLTSTIDCQLGSHGHVAATTAVALMPPGATWLPPGSLLPESHPGGVGPDTFVADEVRSACNANPAGSVASTTIVNGFIQTDDDPFTTEPVPMKPPPNYTRQGTVLSDTFTMVLNEQIQNPDGSITVNAVHEYLHGPTAIGHLVIGSVTCGPLTAVPIPDVTHLRTDFNGNGRDEVAVFRPSQGVWYSKDTIGAGTTAAYGVAGDIPINADYDGDDKEDVAVFRPDAGGTGYDQWFVKRSGGGETALVYGITGDVPVPADYDGDGKTDIAVFRPSTGWWYIRESLSGTENVFAYGIQGDVPVPADYDGDGEADPAVFRPSRARWFNLTSGGPPGQRIVDYGTTGDVPVPADYDGDGKADIGVFRPSNGVWSVQQSTGGQLAASYGVSGDEPSAADYDGDGKADLAVFRPSNNQWFALQSSTGVEAATTWGTSGDTAVVLAPAIRLAYFG